MLLKIGVMSMPRQAKCSLGLAVTLDQTRFSQLLKVQGKKTILKFMLVMPILDGREDVVEVEQM